jgi:hypothetical protein
MEQIDLHMFTTSVELSGGEIAGLNRAGSRLPAAGATCAAEDAEGLRL